MTSYKSVSLVTVSSDYFVAVVCSSRDYLHPVFDVLVTHLTHLCLRKGEKVLEQIMLIVGKILDVEELIRRESVHAGKVVRPNR